MRGGRTPRTDIMLANMMMQSTNIRNTHKLTEDGVQSLLTKYMASRNIAIRDQIVLQYSNLVESVARRFVCACEPVEDLVQEGYIGLITSVDLYDPSKGVKFSTYATHFIIGQIKHYLRDKGKIIKEPAWLQELNQRVSRVIDSLTQKNGRPPTEQEVGEIMDLPEDTVAELLTTREVFKVSSLDAGTDRDDGSGYPVDTDKIKDQKYTTFQLPIEDKIVLETAMDRLKSIEQKVIYEFYYLDHNQTEIARKLNISCNYVSHILRNSTKKLKKILMTDEIRDAQIQVTQLSRRLQDQNRVLEQYTVVDTLTGVYNRKYLMERLDEEINRACRYNHPVGFVLVRIELPETVGRLTKLIRTDDILTQAAQKIRASVRKGDVVARFDDQIFAIILPHAGVQAANVAERVRKSLIKDTLQSAESKESIHAEVDTSWASYPTQATNADDLVKAVATGLGISETESGLIQAA
ncbi:MAG: sigma-70 family RNA polymerase sigma factor [Armatimonadota bacterium]